MMVVHLGYGLTCNESPYGIACEPFSPEGFVNDGDRSTRSQPVLPKALS